MNMTKAFLVFLVLVGCSKNEKVEKMGILKKYLLIIR